MVDTNFPRFDAACELPADTDLLTAQFAQDGFLVFENFSPVAACEVLIQRANLLVAEFDPACHSAVFSSRSTEHSRDEYFRSSGDKIRFFFEGEAFRDDGGLAQDKALSINKIGHALHDLDPLFNEYSRQPKIAALTKIVGPDTPLLLQSMYLFKQPRIGEEVTCHQDSTFLFTDPDSCIGFWIALQDATLENGCLWAIPGRHALRRRYRYRGDELVTESIDPTPLPLENAIPLEVPQGTLIVLDGGLPHYSGANRSDRSRHAYSLHLIGASCDYPDDNWLRRSDSMPLRGFN